MKKKLTALFLTLAMCMGLCVPAFAAEELNDLDAISTEENIIVLDSTDDWEALHRRDRITC